MPQTALIGSHIERLGAIAPARGHGQCFRNILGRVFCHMGHLNTAANRCTADHALYWRIRIFNLFFFQNLLCLSFKCHYASARHNAMHHQKAYKSSSFWVFFCCSSL